MKLLFPLIMIMLGAASIHGEELEQLAAALTNPFQTNKFATGLRGASLENAIKETVEDSTALTLVQPITQKAKEIHHRALVINKEAAYILQRIVKIDNHKPSDNELLLRLGKVAENKLFEKEGNGPDKQKWDATIAIVDRAFSEFAKNELEGYYRDCQIRRHYLSGSLRDLAPTSPHGKNSHFTYGLDIEVEIGDSDAVVTKVGASLNKSSAIKIGDRITSVNGVPLKNQPRSIKSRLQGTQSSMAVLTLADQRRQRTVALPRSVLVPNHLIDCNYKFSWNGVRPLETFELTNFSQKDLRNCLIIVSVMSDDFILPKSFVHYAKEWKSGQTYYAHHSARGMDYGASFGVSNPSTVFVEVWSDDDWQQTSSPYNRDYWVEQYTKDIRLDCRYLKRGPTILIFTPGYELKFTGLDYLPISNIIVASHVGATSAKAGIRLNKEWHQREKQLILNDKLNFTPDKTEVELHFQNSKVISIFEIKP